MNDSPRRARYLAMAAGMREAAEALRANCYAEPSTTWERDYNFAMRDAADLVSGLAEETEDNG